VWWWLTAEIELGCKRLAKDRQAFPDQHQLGKSYQKLLEWQSGRSVQQSSSNHGLYLQEFQQRSLAPSSDLQLLSPLVVWWMVYEVRLCHWLHWYLRVQHLRWGRWHGRQSSLGLMPHASYCMSHASLLTLRRGHLLALPTCLSSMPYGSRVHGEGGGSNKEWRQEDGARVACPLCRDSPHLLQLCLKSSARSTESHSV